MKNNKHNNDASMVVVTQEWYYRNNKRRYEIFQAEKAKIIGINKWKQTAWLQHIMRCVPKVSNY